MTQAEQFFTELAAANPDVKLGKMFGSWCMKTANGKSGAMFWKDNIVVKLPEKELNEALALDGVRLFEPMEGKPMKDWVQLPFDYHEQWEKYASISIDQVKQLKNEKVKKKK